MIVAEELEADWSKIAIEIAPAEAIYKNPEFNAQFTGASTSIKTSWDILRNAGACAREILVAAVAKIVGIPKYKLRSWTDRYLTHIQKIEIGNTQHRRFTEKDIKIIKRIDQLMNAGHTLKSVA